MAEVLGGAVYELDLDQSRFRRGLADAEGQARGLGSRLAGGIAPAQGEFDKLGTAATRSGLSLGNFTRTAAAVGVGLIGTQAAIHGVRSGFDLTIGSAIRFESAMANVAKTSGASDAEIEQLGNQFRALSKEFPTTATGLAKIAATAAQVGITTPDLAEFTEVMAKLDTAIEGLDAEGATVAIARFTNIMGTAVGDVDNLAAALVDLGNKGASTEAEILEFSLRLAGAGRTLGLSEQDVLGLSNALASLGLHAEAGGTAYSRVMLEIFAASKQGARGVESFADVSDMTADAFLNLVKTNPVEAILAFVSGLGRMNEEGGNVIAVLEDLELGEIRVRDALLRTSGAQDLVRKSVNDANTAWAENTALEAEAARQAETTASRIQILKNRFSDIGLEIGTVVIPALKGVVDALIFVDKSSRLISGRLFGIDFGNLPGPLGGAAGVSVTGTVGDLIGGNDMKKAAAEAQRLIETQARLTADANLSVVASMGGVPPATAAAAAAVTTLGTRYEELRRNLNNAEDAQKDLTQAMKDATSVFTTMNPVVQGNEAIIAENERQIAGLIARYGKDMPPAMQRLIDGYEAQNKKLKEVNDVYEASGNTIQQYAESIDATATRQGLAIGSGTLLAKSLVQVTDDANESIAAMQGFQRVLNATSAQEAIAELTRLKRELDPKTFAEIAKAIGPAIVGRIADSIADPALRAELLAAARALGVDTVESVAAGISGAGSDLAETMKLQMEAALAAARITVGAGVTVPVRTAPAGGGTASAPTAPAPDLPPLQDVRSIPGLAVGGYVSRPGVFSLAERGPEWVIPDRIVGGRIQALEDFIGTMALADSARRPLQSVEDFIGTMGLADTIRPFQTTEDVMNTMQIADRTSFGQPEGVVNNINVYGATIDEQERQTIRIVTDFFRRRRTESLRSGSSISYAIG